MIVESSNRKFDMPNYKTKSYRKTNKQISFARNHIMQLEELPINQLQRALKGQNITPQMVQAIQRTHGNKIASQIVQNQQPKTIQRFTQNQLLTVFDKAYNTCLFRLSGNYDMYHSHLPENHPLTYENALDSWANGGGPIKDMITKASEEAHLGETPHFLRAVEHYKVSPDFATGQDIMNKYVRTNSEEEINISGTNRHKIVDFFSGPTQTRNRR